MYHNVVELLLKEPIEIEGKDKLDRTALHWAAATGNDRLLHNLLSGACGRKADLRACNRRNKTAIHVAAENNHAHIATILLSYGADSKATSDGAWTALHIAAEKGYIGIVGLLLEYNADCNAETSHGMTPLHWAARNGHLEIVKLLLSRSGAKRHSKDSSGYSPLMLAGKNQHIAIMQLLSSFNDGRDLSRLAKQACEEYQATITDFFPQKTERRKFAVFNKPSVYDLLYGSDSRTGKPTITIRTEDDSKAKPAFRWIHLPANNVCY